jgi:hypothetical protein
MRTILFTCALAALGACQDDLLNDLPDASPDPDSVTLPPGDFSCVDVAWPTTAPATLTLSGKVIDSGSGIGVGGATVDLLDANSGAVLASGSSDTAAATVGNYAIDLATGGTAPEVIRRARSFGRVDGYEVDPVPVSSALLARDQFIPSNTPEMHDGYLTIGGIVPDPAAGILTVYVTDCAGAPLAGATVDVEGAEDLTYLTAAHQVDWSAGLTETSSDGGALAANVPAGPVEVTVTLPGVTYRHRPAWSFAGADVTVVRFP